MEHNIIELNTDSEMKSMVLYQKDNNLDKRDNLDELPESPAVYAVCGRVNSQPANPRYVGETDNLRQAIKQHFSGAGNIDDCFREFMLSIKTKSLVFQELPGSTEAERQQVKADWENRLKPECNEVLNIIH